MCYLNTCGSHYHNYSHIKYTEHFYTFLQFFIIHYLNKHMYIHVHRQHIECRSVVNEIIFSSHYHLIIISKHLGVFNYHKNMIFTGCVHTLNLDQFFVIIKNGACTMYVNRQNSVFKKNKKNLWPVNVLLWLCRMVVRF